MRTNSGLPASTVESRRRLLLVTGALFLALTVWTILVAATPVVGFGVAWPRTRLSPESIGIVVHVLVAILIYLRYEVTGSPRLFVISLAFVGLAFSQFVLGASVGQIGGPVSPEAVYLWTAGRIVSACLLLAGAFVVRPDRSPSDGSGPRFFWAAAAVVVGLGAIDVVIWAARHRLPPLSSAVPAQISRAVAVLPGLTPADLIMGSVGAALYFAAALAYLRPTAPAIREVGWLAPALVIAGFGHLHYMLFPAILTDRLSTGDLLRLAFSASLLAGAAWEVRRSVQTERERATELERLYGAEKARVQELEAADRTRAELFSVLTHELAHPVAAIRGFAMTLSTRWRKLDDATRDRALQRMDHESKRLRDLAEEVVSVSRLDTPGFSLTTRPDRVRNLLEEALGGAEGMESRLLIDADEQAGSLMVDIDRARMLQVFRNLLSNAVKYSPEGAPIRLEVEQLPAAVVFRVKDSGPGIPEEDLPRLFHQFSRVHRQGEHDSGGSGLGLYISRRIVEGHGGRIWVETEPGQGSTFAFTIPLGEGGR